MKKSNLIQWGVLFVIFALFSGFWRAVEIFVIVAGVHYFFIPELRKFLIDVMREAKEGD